MGVNVKLRSWIQGFILKWKKTVNEIMNLIYLIKDKVYKEFGVILECEIKTLGNVNL